MIALIESGDIDTLGTRHMTHVGIMTGNDDANGGLVIQHVLPHGKGRKPKLLNSVIERHYLRLRRRLTDRRLLLRQRVQGHKTAWPKKTHEHTRGALGIGAIGCQVSIAVESQLQQIRRVRDPPVEIQIEGRMM